MDPDAPAAVMVKSEPAEPAEPAEIESATTSNGAQLKTTIVHVISGLALLGKTFDTLNAIVDDLLHESLRTCKGFPRMQHSIKLCKSSLRTGKTLLAKTNTSAVILKVNCVRQLAMVKKKLRVRSEAVSASNKVSCSASGAWIPFGRV